MSLRIRDQNLRRLRTRIFAVCLAGCAFSGAGLGAGLVEDDEIVLQIGSQAVNVPIPWGYVEVSNLVPRIREMAQAMTPDTHELLAVFISGADLELLIEGRSVGLERYMLLQTARVEESTTVTATEFNAQRARIQAQQAPLLEEMQQRVGEPVGDVSQMVSQQLERAIDLQIGDSTPLGIFIDTERQMALATLTKYRVSAEGRAFDYLIVGATNFIHIADRVLLLYIYAIHNSHEDFEWVRKLSQLWVSEIFADNSMAIPDEISADRETSIGSYDVEPPRRATGGGLHPIVLAAAFVLLLGMLWFGMRSFARKSNE